MPIDSWQSLGACDQCGHPAPVRWAKGQHQLMLCSHHSNRQELALTVSGWHIAEDIRGQHVD